MKTVFSTADIHPRDRFICWHEVACKHLVDHDSSPESRASFWAELQAGALSDIGLVLFENASMTISHSRQHVARANPEELFVCRQLAGRLVLDQEAREVVLEPGDMTLLDPRLPYSGRFSGDSRLLVLKVPRYALEARIGKTRMMVSRLIKPSNAENGLTAAFLALLPSHADGLSRPSEHIVREQALDLSRCIPCERNRRHASAHFISAIFDPCQCTCRDRCTLDRPGSSDSAYRRRCCRSECAIRKRHPC